MVTSPDDVRVVLVGNHDEETTMNKLITTSTLGLAGLVATGLVAWQAPMAFGDDADDRPSHSGTHSGKAFKRDDDSQVLVTTVDDDDDDDTGLNHQTRTNTNTNGGTNTRGGRDHSRRGDHSRSGSVRDLTSDGPGSGNVDRSRHHTNDGTRHNTRGR
jgi:hypothetical protein